MNKYTTEAAGKFWLTGYAILPDFLQISSYTFFISHSVSYSHSALPTQTSTETTPAESPLQKRHSISNPL